MKLLSIFQAIMADQRAATAVEYGLILALVFLALMGGVAEFGTELKGLFTHVTTTSVNAMQGV